eukprot:gene2644-biopygen6541
MGVMDLVGDGRKMGCHRRCLGAGGDVGARVDLQRARRGGRVAGRAVRGARVGEQHRRGAAERGAQPPRGGDAEEPRRAGERARRDRRRGAELVQPLREGGEERAADQRPRGVAARLLRAPHRAPRRVAAARRRGGLHRLRDGEELRRHLGAAAVHDRVGDRPAREHRDRLEVADPAEAEQLDALPAEDLRHLPRQRGGDDELRVRAVEPLLLAAEARVCGDVAARPAHHREHGGAAVVIHYAHLTPITY